MQNEREQIEAQIREIKAKMKENKRKIRQNKIGMFVNRLKIIKGRFLILLHNIWLQVRFALKVPVILILFILIALRSIWDVNLRAMLLNIYHRRYNEDELMIILGHFDNITTHGAFVFYIILLACHLYFN
jgi:hypothetical protein